MAIYSAHRFPRRCGCVCRTQLALRVFLEWPTWCRKDDTAEVSIYSFQRERHGSRNLGRPHARFFMECKHLLSGMTPSINWLDQPIDSTPYAFAKGWRGCLCQARGDWQWYCEAFRFPQWNSAARMCFVCRASSTIPGVEWHDFSDHPGWEGTEWSHEDYCTYLRLAGYAIPVLFALCIGFRLECICIDHLHCVDLGVSSIFSGNILWYYSTLGERSVAQTKRIRLQI